MHLEKKSEGEGNSWKKEQLARWRGGFSISTLFVLSVLLGKWALMFCSIVVFWRGVSELIALAGISQINIPKLLTKILTVLCFVAAVISERALDIWLLLSGLVSFSFYVLRPFFMKDKGIYRINFADLPISLFCIFYCGWLPAHFVLLRHLHTDPTTLEFLNAGTLHCLMLGISISFNDMGAYYIGKNLGRVRLLASVSPNKTIEGALGGIFSGALSFTLMNISLSSIFGVEGLVTWKAILCGAFLCLLAQLGDMAESLIKRSVGVKDSGQSIEGQGGILDRFDGHLFAWPVAYYIFYWLF